MRRAFVIQFDGVVTDEHCRGRIEHVDSGRHEHFNSFAEAERFARQVLDEEELNEPDDGRPDLRRRTNH